MKIFATYNIKGGVGKTSAAVNLAYLAANSGRRTLLWDLDPQAAATYVYQVKARVKHGGKALITGKRPLDGAIRETSVELLDLLPADFDYRNMDLDLDSSKKPTRRLARVLSSLEGSYDAVFLDCPPSISLVSENVMHAANTLLVPIIPTTLSVRTLEQVDHFLEGFDGSRPSVLAFFSMVDGRKRLHRETMERLWRDRSDIASTTIPALSVVEEMTVRQAPVLVFAPKSRPALAYAQLWEELVQRDGGG